MLLRNGLLSLRKFDLLSDIYYNDKYIALYIKENEEVFNFKYTEGDKLFVNKAIKRPIIQVGNIKINDNYYDLETAYGYGGCYTNTEDKLFIKKAISEYQKKCNDERIIAEFIRFHPFNDFPIMCSEYLDFNSHDRNVIVKDLYSDILASYTSKVRNTIKRATEKVSFRESKNIDKFIELYTKTMQKNNASDFYFFERKYYQTLIDSQKVKLYEIIFEDDIIAMAFFLFGQEMGHYHLSTNTPLSYKLNSNYALLHNTFNIFKGLGLKYVILGGGTTSNGNDSLFKFKKKFSDELKSFYIGGKIYNEKIYDEYIKLWESQTDKDIKYFLKYRLELE